MRIFATGVTGFLGSHVAEALLRAGHHVVALARDPSAIDSDLAPWLTDGANHPAGRGEHGRDPARAEGGPASASVPRAGMLSTVRGSLFDEAALRAGIEGTDAIVHAAGLIQAAGESEYMKVNGDGTEAVLRVAEECSGARRRFVLVSSQAAGGPARSGRPLSEQDPARPVSAYGRSKRAGEERALSRTGTMPITILRPPVIFGPRDRMLARMFRAVARGTAVVWRDGSNTFNVVHAADVARAVRLAIEAPHPSGSIFYTGDDRVFSWRSFIGLLAATTGAHVRILRVPQPVFAAAAAGSTAFAILTRQAPFFALDKLRELREPAWLCSSAAIRQALGWSPAITIEEGLAATHAWYKRREML